MSDFLLPMTDWYRQNARNLPWRETKDPYKIWLSEVILQQTRVEQGKPYYYKFVENFENIVDLANADQEEVLKNWQGLGYYSRARNLHQAAKTVRDDFNGTFPSSYKEILSLKGIGEYTAAAIASFAFDLPHAVVDGNVYRVLSRYFDIDTPIDSTKGKKQFFELANELLYKDDPALFNQAIMEFGAMQCVPVSPNCGVCPLIQGCSAYKNQTISIRPVKANKIKVTERFFNYLVFQSDEGLILKRRGPKDVWEGLYDFPLVETENKIEEIELVNVLDMSEKMIKKVSSTKHILSHQRLFIQFVEIAEVPNKMEWQEDWELVSFEDLPKIPFPKVIERFLDQDLKTGL